jgi:hypothetical protein
LSVCGAALFIAFGKANRSADAGVPRMIADRFSEPPCPEVDRDDAKAGGVVRLEECLWPNAPQHILCKARQ